MKIKRFIGGVLQSNGYVIYQEEGGPCYVVDPGYTAANFIDFIAEKHLKPKGILLTHHHYDHTGAVDKLKARFSCPVHLHRQDMDLYKKDGLSVSGKAGAEKGEAVAAPGRIQCGHGQGPSEPGAAF